MELPSKASSASSQIASATAELRQARNTISMQSKELAKNAQLRMSMKSLEDNVAFYNGSEGSPKSEFAVMTTKSTVLV